MRLRVGRPEFQIFPRVTLKIRKRNCITKIKLDDGTWINDGEAIQNYFRNRFCSLYKSANPRIPSSLKELIKACITKEENEVSCRIPTGDEIKKVKWSMNPLKAPSSNGFPRLFYKHYWDEIGGQVILAVESFFRNE